MGELQSARKNRRREGGGIDERSEMSAFRPSRLTLMFLVVGVLCLLMWSLMHRSVINIEVEGQFPSSSKGRVGSDPLTKSPDPTNVQKLLDDTKSLLKDIINANLSLNHAIMTDFREIQEERLNVLTDLTQIKDSHQKVLTDLNSCTSESTRLAKKVNNLNTELNETKKRLKASNINCEHGHITATTFTSQEGSIELPIPQHHLAIKGDHDSHHHTRAERWLTIGIPTVSRANNEDYLLKTLAALEAEFTADPSDLMFTQILVVIVNIQGKGHARFEEAVMKYGPNSNHPKSAYFEFVTLSSQEESSAEMKDPLHGKVKGLDLGNANVPGYRVRKQTRSIAMVMQKAMGRAKFFQFLEDDMLLCRGGLQATHHMLAKATRYHHNWIALRASYGMNGIFLHDADMAHFRQYLLKHQTRRPPDHLAVEWYAGETKESGEYRAGRRNVAYRFNLYDHIGIHSTLREVKQTSFPRCYESLGEPTLFKVEAFDSVECPRDDIWPCRVLHREPMYVRFKGNT